MRYHYSLITYWHPSWGFDVAKGTIEAPDEDQAEKKLLELYPHGEDIELTTEEAADEK